MHPEWNKAFWRSAYDCPPDAIRRDLAAGRVHYQLCAVLELLVPCRAARASDPHEYVMHASYDPRVPLQWELRFHDRDDPAFSLHARIETDTRNLYVLYGSCGLEARGRTLRAPGIFSCKLPQAIVF